MIFEPSLIPAPDEEAPMLFKDEGFSDSPSSLELLRGIESYQASIKEIEADEGPFSERLKQESMSLAQLLQARGQHEEAIDHLLRAHDISRTNNGLYNLDQLPIIEALTTSYMALGQLQYADAMQESVVAIHKGLHGERNVAVIPALMELGDWNLRAFFERRNIVNDINRVDVERVRFDPSYMQTELRPEQTSVFKVFQAQGNYLNALNIIRQNRAYYHENIAEIENKIAATYFVRTHQENIIYDPDFYLTRKIRKTGSRLNQATIMLRESEDYVIGREALFRIVEHAKYRPEQQTRMTAEAMINVADWDLLFKRGGKAVKEYREAYEILTEEPGMEELLTQLLNPEIPVILPAFLDAPHSRGRHNLGPDDEVQYEGYIDVSFTLDKFGKARKLKVLERSSTANKSVEIRLLKYIRNMQFRPRLVEGDTPKDPYELRYYFGRPA